MLLLQIAAVIAIFMPLWESRDVFARVVGIQDTMPRDQGLPQTAEGQLKTHPSATGELDDSAHGLKA